MTMENAENILIFIMFGILLLFKFSSWFPISSDRTLELKKFFQITISLKSKNSPYRQNCFFLYDVNEIQFSKVKR